MDLPTIAPACSAIPFSSPWRLILLTPKQPRSACGVPLVLIPSFLANPACSANVTELPIDTAIDPDLHPGKGSVYSRWRKSRFLKFLPTIFTNLPLGIEIIWQDGRYKG